MTVKMPKCTLTKKDLKDYARLEEKILQRHIDLCNYFNQKYDGFDIDEYDLNHYCDNGQFYIESSSLYVELSNDIQDFIFEDFCDLLVDNKILTKIEKELDSQVKQLKQEEIDFQIEHAKAMIKNGKKILKDYGVEDVEE